MPKILYNEIYVNDEFSDALDEALEKLSKEHPEWGFSSGAWDTLEEDEDTPYED